METQTLQDFVHHMSLVEITVKEARLEKNPEKKAFYQSELERILPGHRAQIPQWIADDFKGAGK